MTIELDGHRARLIETELADSGEEARAKKAVRDFLRNPSPENYSAALSLLTALPENRVTALKQICGSQ